MSTVLSTRSPAPDTLTLVSWASLSFTPLYLLLQLRERFSLDNLHITLFEVVFLFLLNNFLRVKSKITSKTATPTQQEIAVTEKDEDVKVEQKAKKGKLRIKGARQPKVHPLFPPSMLDRTLHRFLSISSPNVLSVLPQPSPSGPASLPPLPLKDWKSIFRAEEDNDLVVVEHPTQSGLYAICATFEDVPVKKLIQGLRDVTRRKEWDSICDSGETIEDIRPPLSQGRLGTISHLKMKGMAIIKPKDMVLLSSIASLPEGTPSVYPDDKGKKNGLKMVVAATSVEHPRAPEERAYNRMKLDVSGFIVEEYGAEGQGSRLIQITDLSGLGSWVPSSVTRTVITKMIPKSLRALAKLASTLPEPDESENNFLPELGSWFQKKEGESETAEESEEDEEESEDEAEEDSSSTTLTPPNSFNLRNLITQLRSVTSRLEVLESNSTPSSSKSGSSSSSWISVLKSKAGETMTEQKGNGLVGFASGAASVASVAALWWILGERRRRRGKIF
ncbi:Bet v1-like protein [Atractiella rhizophila]|nr:Bet v1-like protein [Atractiella rhizophila]